MTDQSYPFSQADAGAELKRLDKWLAKTEEKLDGGKIVVGVTIIQIMATNMSMSYVEKYSKVFFPFRSQTA